VELLCDVQIGGMERLRRFGLALSLAVWCGATTANAAVCAPTSLVHIVVTAVTPGISAGSFEAQPRSIYRFGPDKLRIEEAPDPANAIHGLIVNAEPDIWMVNLFDGSGKHIVDPGPTFNVVAPVFGIEGIAPGLLALEFGCEAEYIAANAPAPVRSEQVGASRYQVYRVAEGTDAVEILELSGSAAPSFARLYHRGRLALALRYDLFTPGLPMDPKLFVRPSGVRFTEAGS
jgi:hypothetical protein